MSITRPLNFLICASLATRCLRFSILSLLIFHALKGQIIGRVAGGDDPGKLPLSQVSLRGSALTINSNGELYSALNNSIYRVDVAANRAVIFAGGVTLGFSGEGESVAQVAINSQSGATVDNAGNFYFADSANNRIWKLDKRLVSLKLLRSLVQSGSRRERLPKTKIPRYKLAFSPYYWLQLG